MSKVNSFRNIAIAIVILALGAVATWAQPPDKKNPNDPTGNARNVSKEASDIYKKWKNNDVAYIITNEEKKAFEALCAAQDITPSQVVRQMIRDYMLLHGVTYSTKNKTDTAPAEENR